ncbi:hypothetical protein H6P81_002566 [Aristolochia fimbriata]|uniref:FLZ-type domain-containing protein n=1 Tax=Aristolochia fimbriata TaxID=158543 RepID=A0AAV7FEP4_ARIFI|nr:hypothetical protein H6P81_002566 [Aristolochia fimbriata]
MLGKKRCRDSPRRPPEAVVTGGESLVGFSDVPASPTETRVGSPNKWRSKESEAVGLGIIAALQKSGDVQAKFVVGGGGGGGLNLSRTDPIPVGKNNSTGDGGVDERSDVGRSESFTSVTYRGRHRLSVTRDDGKSRNMGVFLASSPPRFTEDFMGFQTSDFLSYCHLCWKKLHGKDIYMYRGEKAFCSSECRYRQIVSDEYQEKCRSEASEISNSSYNTDILLSPGIAAV